MEIETTVVARINDHGPIVQRDDPDPVVSSERVFAEVSGEDGAGAEVYANNHSGRTAVHLEAKLGQGARLVAHGSRDGVSVDLAMKDGAASEFDYNVGPSLHAYHEDQDRGEHRRLRVYVTEPGVTGGRVDISVEDGTISVYNTESGTWVDAGTLRHHENPPSAPGQAEPDGTRGTSGD